METIGHYTLVPWPSERYPKAVAIRLPDGTMYGASAAKPHVLNPGTTVERTVLVGGSEAKQFTRANAEQLIGTWERDIANGVIPPPGPVPGLDLEHPRAKREREKQQTVTVSVQPGVQATATVAPTPAPPARGRRAHATEE